MQRLDYKIPPFISVAWVSDAAQAKWYPQIRRLNRAMLHSTMTGVAEGIWEERRIRVPGALALRAKGEAQGLGVEVLEVGQKGEKGTVFSNLLIRKVGAENGNLGDGIPACCKEYHAEVIAKGYRESVWESALATPGHRQKEDRIIVQKGFVFGPFWQKLLINLFSYSPCHLHCPETMAQTERHFDWMRQMGFEKEADMLAGIAQWPLEWSVSHGICELRTPVVKLAYETDATDRAYQVQLNGPIYPELGASGLNFPYRRGKFLRITDSKSFKEGLKHGN